MEDGLEGVKGENQQANKGILEVGQVGGELRPG